MSNIYENPDGQPANITQINNTFSNLVNELNPCQLAISIDTTRLTPPCIVFKDDIGNIYNINSIGVAEHTHTELSETLYIKNNKVGIKEQNPTSTLHVNGDITANLDIMSWGNINTKANFVGLASRGITLTTDSTIGNDTKYAVMCAAGDGWNSSRSGYIAIYGQNDSVVPGQISIVAGDGTPNKGGIIQLLSKTLVNSGTRPFNNNTWDMAFNEYFTIWKNGFDENYILFNSYLSSGQWKYRETTPNCATRMNVSGTGYSFFVAENGTKDTNISWTEALRIKSNGNVGIKTNNPSTSFHVNGSTKITEDLLVGNSKTGIQTAPSFISLGSSYNDTPVREKCKIYLYTDGGTERYGFGVGNNSDIQYHSNGKHDFFIANTKKVTINSTGVGIGTTSPQATLHVQGSLYVSDGIAGIDSTKFMSTSHAGTYWLVNNWDGTRWYITSNHGSPVRVGYADSAGSAGSATNADTTDGYHLGNRTNWNSLNSIDIVTGQLAWKNYGNGHTIFDASSGLSPNGTAVNNTNSEVSWTATYPTLMGWNGINTFGVRVDSARVSDSTNYAAQAGNTNKLNTYDWNTYLGKFANTAYQANADISLNSVNYGLTCWNGINHVSIRPTDTSLRYGTWTLRGNGYGSYSGFHFQDSFQQSTLMSYAHSAKTGFYNQSTSAWQWYYNGSNILIQGQYPVWHSGNLNFNTILPNMIPKWSGSNLSQSMLIDTGSAVGVGMSSPEYTLDVNGTIRAASTIYTASTMISKSTSSFAIKMDNDSKYIVLCGGSNTYGYNGSKITLYGNTALGRPGDVVISSGTAGTILLNGKTSVNYRPLVNLGYDFAVSDIYTFFNDLDNSQILHNNYQSSSASYRRVAGQGAVKVKIGNNSDSYNNGFYIYTANEGAADSVISWNRGFSVDYRGYVGVGTFSPVINLDVKGSQRISEDLLVGYGNNSAQTSPCLDVRGIQTISRNLTVGLEKDGAQETPYFISLGGSYNTTVNKDKLKLFIRSDGYGFTVGNGLDMRYHTGSSFGAHDFYFGNNLGMAVHYNGVGIGNVTQPQQKLDVAGNARFQQIGSGSPWGNLSFTLDGTLTSSTSDIRKKKNIKKLEDKTIDKIMLLNPVTFKWKENDTESIGLIAQEVEKVFPILTFTNPVDKYMGLRYDLFSAVLIKGEQELNNKINELEEENKNLKETIKNILKRLEDLEK